NGYKAFYIMKYELSQHAYADFLNTLTYQQQQQRAANALPDKPTETRFYAATRNFLRIYIPGKIFNPGLDEEYQVPATYGHFIEGAHNWEAEYNAGNVAMNYLNWTDIAAYLCWAGLRPLTELEYEKACRGATKALLKEFAWGTKSMVKNEIGKPPLNAAKPNELAQSSSANFISQSGTHSFITFPIRVGCLATATSNRREAGAGFYGALNLSDNVSEIYINVSSAEGLKYTGEHGSGILSTDGNGFVKSWPDAKAVGTGIRGVYQDERNAEVSNRTNIELKITNRDPLVGCRGGRTAP
ncbi:MAG: SUMF1/EgtB/PvdO family nonheme iron enzyme, partial [Bacteroidales bacterium]